MKPEALKANLESLRARIEKLDSEAAYHDSNGNELLAKRMRDEQRQLEIEAGHIAHALRDGG